MIKSFDNAQKLIQEMSSTLIPIRDSVHQGATILSEIHNHVTGVLEICSALNQLINKMKEETALLTKNQEKSGTIPKFLKRPELEEKHMVEKNSDSIQKRENPTLGLTYTESEKFNMDPHQLFSQNLFLNSAIKSFIVEDLKLLATLPAGENSHEIGQPRNNLSIADPQIRQANEEIRNIHRRLFDMVSRKQFSS